MKHTKRMMVGLLSSSLLFFSAGTLLAANQPVTEISDSYATNYNGGREQQAQFGQFTGKIKEISPCAGLDCARTVLVENEDGAQANLIVSRDTYRLNCAEIVQDAVITGYYDANAPMIMIYPPQFKAAVLVADTEGVNVKVDRFDRDLTSADGSLKLNISADTKIMLEDGTVFDGSLADRNLIVVYGATTRSIPAQTTPSKVIVLFEKAVHPIMPLPEDDQATSL